jgi:hypothetical protein
MPGVKTVAPMGRLRDPQLQNNRSSIPRHCAPTSATKSALSRHPAQTSACPLSRAKQTLLLTQSDILDDNACKTRQESRLFQISSIAPFLACASLLVLAKLSARSSS